jgi:tetratricopeptide (TPR) repeat protein
MFDKAVEVYEIAQQLQRQRGPKDPEVIKHVAFSASLMHQSLLYDPSNYGTYYNVGMMLVALDQSEVAEAYIRQALEIQPWPQRDGPEYYHQLGVALVKQKKTAQALAAWEEGIAKYGSKSGKLWEHLAVYHVNESMDGFQAAYCAAVAKFIGDTAVRASVVDKIESDARAKLDAADVRKLDTLVRKIYDMLKLKEADSQQQFRAGKRYLVEAFATYVKDASSLTAVASTPGAAEPGRAATSDAPATPAPAAPEKPLVELDLAIPVGSVDLLADVNVERDGVQGSWKFDKKALVTPYTQFGRLIVPTAPPEEYDLTLIVERKSGGQEFVIGFVRSGVQTAFFLDANAGRNSGIDPNAAGAFAGKLLEVDKPATIVLKVRREGLLATVEGNRVFFERTDTPFAEAPSDWQVRDSSKLFVGAHASRCLIHKLMLTPYRRP